MTCFCACSPSFLHDPSSNFVQPSFDACLVWKREIGVPATTAGRARPASRDLLDSSETGMLACVVDCSQICQARSTNSCRRTRCEGKLWLLERDLHDQDIVSRAFPSSLGCSEGSRKSESDQCLDGSYGQLLCITAAKDGHESEIDGVENDEGSEEEQGDEESHGRVTETNDDIRILEEAQRDNKSDLKILSLSEDTSNRKVAKPSFTGGLGTKSTTCLKINSIRIPVEQTIGTFSDSRVEVFSAELGHASSLRFGESADCPNNTSEGPGTEKESQLAELGSGSQDFFGEGLDVVGSRKGDERGGAKKGLSSGWGSDNLRCVPEQLSFQGEDTVECITNVGEEEDFGFDVEEFQTSDGQEEEPIQDTPHDERREFHPRRGEQSQGSQDGQRIASGKYESPQPQTENSFIERARLPTHLWTNDQEPEGSLPQTDAATGGCILERVNSGSGRLGRSQEKDDKHRARLEPHQRKGELSVVASEERRVRARLDSSAVGSGRGEETEEAKVVVRPSRPSGGKDRHSKVNTAKGPRDRRVRLSVPTAVQFYDVQDRLGYDQPSKAVEWLIKKAKAAIDELGRLPARGNEGPSAMSDITHPSPFPSALSLSGTPVSGSSSCPPVGSFSASLSGPFGDVSNHMNYFLDSSIQQGMSFGNHPLPARDIGGVGLGQVHLTAGQGHHLTGLGFQLSQTDLSRGSSECTEGFRAGEFGGPSHARGESRVKARERARERVKEKGSVGKVTCPGGSSPSMQSPPLHQSTPIHSFAVQNARQSSIHSLSLQTPPQNSLSSVFNTTLSGIMQSSQQGTLQNLIMQNPSLQSSLTDPDQAQSSLQHSFQVSRQSTMQSSQPMSSMQSPGLQQSHLQMPSLQGNAQPQGALHFGSSFAPGPCSPSFSESSLPSSHYMSVAPLPISQALNVSQLSALGISPPSSIGPPFSGSATVSIPPGFSPGPPASAFRPRPMPIGQGSHNDQQQLQGVSRPQLILPTYNPASGSPTGSSSKASPSSLYYSNTSSRMGSLQSMPPVSLKSPSFSSVRNVNYDFQRGLQMMSPGRTSSSFQTSSSQIPARIQGLSDDFEEDLDSQPPSPPDAHP